MVVDDEQIVIESVKFIVKKEISNIQVVKTAANGREAIQAASEVKPDIVLMDIRMPGINGIEAIKEIKKTYSDVKFVIVSAYEQFDFAKQAVELGVVDYLMKPVNKTKLISTLNKITNELDIEKQKEEIQLDNIEKYKKALTVLEQGFIYSILFNKEYGTDLMKYKEILGLSGSTGYIMILKMTDKKTEKGISTGLKSHKIYTEFKNILKYKTRCVVGPIMVDRIIAYIQDANVDEYDHRIEAIRLSEMLVEKIELKEPEVKLQVAIGSVRSDNELIYSYEEAIKALRAINDNTVIHISDVTGNIMDYENDFRVEEGRLINALESGAKDSIMVILHALFNKCELAGFNSQCDFKSNKSRSKLIELMVVAHRIAAEMDVSQDSYLRYEDYIAEMLAIDNYDKFKKWFIERMSYIANKILIARESSVSEIIFQANNIIKENYKEDISLDGISRQLGISPQYFSRLYKNETGKNFIEYLTEIRIHKAKKLMKENSYSVKEICYMVGYSDPNYFSRLFKKQEGKSPTDYLKGMIE